MGELIFNAIFAVAAVILFVLTFQFPTSIFDKSGGAGLYPRIVIGFLLCFLAIRTVQILRSPEQRKKKFVFFEMFRGPRLIYLIATLAYFLLVKPIGFVITSIVYLGLSIPYFYYLQDGKRPSVRRVVIILVAVVVSVILLDYAFCEVLGVLLPAGLIGF